MDICRHSDTIEDTMKMFYSVSEFAKETRVSTKTIFRAIKKGRISAFRPGSQNGKIRIPASEIERMAIANLEEIVQDMMEERSK